MKINLKIGLNSENNEIETESSTLGELLSELSKQNPDSRFFNRQRWEVNFEYFVEVNGQLHDDLPGELDTKLQENDSIEIYKANEYEED